MSLHVRSNLGDHRYVRYCDDFCLFHNDKKILHKCAQLVREFLDDRLLLKFSKCNVFPVSHGVDFLGYRHFNNYILLRKSTTKRVRRRLSKLPKQYDAGQITAEQYRSSVGSTWGWLKHANSHNLMVALKYHELMQEVKKLV